MPVKMLPESPEDRRMAELDALLIAKVGKVCLICGAPCKQKYCSPECRRVRQREYMQEWQSRPEQRKRSARWRAAHAEELRIKKAAWHAANRATNLRAMQRRRKTSKEESETCK